MQRFPTSLLCAGALLLGAVACSDDDTGSAGEPTTTAPEADSPTTLAEGEDVDLVGEDGLAGQTLNVSAEEANGEVTGELRVSEVVVRVDCADTDTDGFVILGGEVTTGSPGLIEVGELQALIIREGAPDSVTLYANDNDAGSCAAMLESLPEDLLTTESNFIDVEAGDDIQTQA